MSPRLIVGAAVLLLASSLPSARAEAGRGSPVAPGCTVSTNSDSAEVECREPAPGPERPRGVVTTPRACEWVRARAADGWDPGAYGDIANSGYVFFETGDGFVGRRFPDGREELVFNRVCPDGSGFTWVDVTVTVQDAIDDAVDRARRAVPAPSLDMSPPPAVGGVVNLGLWLALAEAPPVTVRAEAGPHWAEATVTLSSTTWSMGNGDVVTCDGPGVPIADLADPGEGPCGYTYRSPSPAGGSYEISVTATWTVSYVSSGGSGAAGTVDRTLSVPYDVDEIQTIGESN